MRYPAYIVIAPVVVAAIIVFFARQPMTVTAEYDYAYAWNQTRTSFWIVGTDEQVRDHRVVSVIPRAFLGRRGVPTATALRIPTHLQRGTRHVSFPIVIDRWLVATFYRDRSEALVAWEISTLRPLTLVSRRQGSLADRYLRLRRPREEGDMINLQIADVDASRVRVTDFAANKELIWRRPDGGK